MFLLQSFCFYFYDPRILHLPLLHPHHMPLPDTLLFSHPSCHSLLPHFIFLLYIPSLPSPFSASDVCAIVRG